MITSARWPTMQILVSIDEVGASPQIGEMLPPCDFFWLSCPVLSCPYRFSRSCAHIEPLDGFSRLWLKRRVSMQRWSFWATSFGESPKLQWAWIKHRNIQVAQLSQRDRAAGWVSNGQKWKTTWETIFMDNIGLYSTTATYLACKEIEIGEKKTQNKGCYAV